MSPGEWKAGGDGLSISYGFHPSPFGTALVMITPIAENGHILLLGWTDRTPTIVRELVVSEGRVGRFLRREGGRGDGPGVAHAVMLGR